MDYQGSLFQELSESAFPFLAVEAAAHDGCPGPAVRVTAEPAEPNVGTELPASGECLECLDAMAYNIDGARPGIGAVDDKARVEVELAGAGDGNEPAGTCVDSMPAGSGPNVEAPVADIGCSEAVVRAGPVPVGTRAELDIPLHC